MGPAREAWIWKRARITAQEPVVAGTLVCATPRLAACPEGVPGLKAEVCSVDIADESESVVASILRALEAHVDHTLGERNE